MKVIVAPLNWGLGHASRCVPMIHALLKANFQPVIASDGAALDFLKKEFPNLETLELPSYKISYGRNLKWKLFKKIPRFLKVAKKEREVVQEYVNSHQVVGIISDNRFGVYAPNVPSVYVTHQLNVRAGILTPVTSYFHQRIIKKFDECWIPDESASQFSGKLSLTKKRLNQKYIGVLSRFQKKEIEKTIDILIVLSGPEPNRTYLEKKLTKKFYGSDLNICLIQGKIEEQQTSQIHGKFRVLNYALSEELESLLNASKMVVCRSGYSSIMDLAVLEKKAVLIPTKGQSEQEYLAKYLSGKGLFDVVKEKNIHQHIIDLNATTTPKKFERNEFDVDLFRLFHGE